MTVDKYGVACLYHYDLRKKKVLLTISVHMDGFNGILEEDRMKDKLKDRKV